jgi:copper chaperone CopZ
METPLTFKVEGMTCGGCARSVQKALESVPGVTVEQVAPGEPVVIRIAGEDVPTAAMAAAVERAGFQAVFETG